MMRIEHGKCWQGAGYVFRIYRGRRALVDFTKASFYRGKGPWVRFRVFGVTVFEVNHQYSGLPKNG